MCADCQLSAQQANAETSLRQIRDNFGTFGCYMFHLLKVGGRAGVLMQTCVRLRTANSWPHKPTGGLPRSLLLLAGVDLDLD